MLWNFKEQTWAGWELSILSWMVILRPQRLDLNHLRSLYSLYLSRRTTILLVLFLNFNFWTAYYLLRLLSLCLHVTIRLLNNKFHWLSPSCGHHSLLFDQRFSNKAQLQRHLANRNAIWRYFVSMRLYLAMLFILSM